MGTILIYYKYVDITYPEQIRKWQHKLATSLNLTGRIIIAHEGINGTVGGTSEAVASYVQAMQEHPLFSDVDFKYSQGSSASFPRLRTVVKEEITRLGIDPQKIKAQDGGIHLSPEQAHAFMQSQADDILVFDARNSYESRIGKFVGAHAPDIENFRDLPAYIDQHLELFKHKKVLMYCTAGVRCERASAYLKSKQCAQEVYQLQGGIQRYVEQFPDGLFRGKNYVFDGRIAVKVNDDILAHCCECHIPYDEYTNCINARCNQQFIACPECLSLLQNACSATCRTLIQTQTVPVRKKPRKVIAVSVS